MYIYLVNSPTPLQSIKCIDWDVEQVLIKDANRFLIADVFKTHDTKTEWSTNNQTTGHIQIKYFTLESNAWYASQVAHVHVPFLNSKWCSD